MYTCCFGKACVQLVSYLFRNSLTYPEVNGSTVEKEVDHSIDSCNLKKNEYQRIFYLFTTFVCIICFLCTFTVSCIYFLRKYHIYIYVIYCQFLRLTVLTLNASGAGFCNAELTRVDREVLWTSWQNLKLSHLLKLPPTTGIAEHNNDFFCVYMCVCALCWYTENIKLLFFLNSIGLSVSCVYYLFIS